MVQFQLCFKTFLFILFFVISSFGQDKPLHNNCNAINNASKWKIHWNDFISFHFHNSIPFNVNVTSENWSYHTPQFKITISIWLLPFCFCLRSFSLLFFFLVVAVIHMCTFVQFTIWIVFVIDSVHFVHLRSMQIWTSATQQCNQWSSIPFNLTIYCRVNITYGIIIIITINVSLVFIPFTNVYYALWSDRIRMIRNNPLKGDHMTVGFIFKSNEQNRFSLQYFQFGVLSANNEQFNNNCKYHRLI